jgi:hypothetical protein
MFASRRVRVLGDEIVGSKHLRLRVASVAPNGHAWRAIAFRQAGWHDCLPPLVDIAYHMEEDRFVGDGSVQLQIEDIRPAEPK